MQTSIINIILIILIVVIIIVLVRKIYMREHFTSETSNEAIQNVASLFNSNNFKVSNLQVSGNSQLNNLQTSGTSQLNNLQTTGTSQLNTLQVTGNAQLNTLTTNSINILPHGTVTLWYGATPPTGWTLCDGTNGTPNLNSTGIILGCAGMINALSYFKLAYIMKL